MQAEVRWLEGRSFKGESGSGHSVIMDGPPDQGGSNLGVRPMEMMLLGLGGCSSYDVVEILEKGRQEVEGCVVDLQAERASSVPAVFERIHLHFRVSGRGLDEKKISRAIELSLSKYCSATIMLERAGVKITHDYEVVSDLQRDGTSVK